MDIPVLPDVSDLLITDLRIKAYQYIITQPSFFTARDMVKELKGKEIKISERFAQHFLRQLYQRNFLEGKLHRESERRGRFTNCYRVKGMKD